MVDGWMESFEISFAANVKAGSLPHGLWSRWRRRSIGRLRSKPQVWRCLVEELKEQSPGQVKGHALLEGCYTDESNHY